MKKQKDFWKELWDVMDYVTMYRMTAIKNINLVGVVANE
jgi:hypothetical protein